LLLLNFVVLLVHRFEEYGWPGGFPAIMNMVLQPSPTPDHYKLNQNSAMAVNVLAAYGFYLIAVFFPTVIWLGLAPVLFGMLQFVVHGIGVNVKLRSLSTALCQKQTFWHLLGSLGAGWRISSSKGYRNAHQGGADGYHCKAHCPWPKPCMTRKNEAAKK
jgi:Protein of unknown function with HXXEE motif